MPVKRLLLIYLATLASFATWSQKTQEDDYASGIPKEEVKAKVPFRDRLVFGGNLGGKLGTYSYFNANPMVGYKTTPWWVNGVGLNYMYIAGGGIKQNIIGPTAWTRAYIYRAFIIHSEYEFLNLKASDQAGHTFKTNVPVWFVGAGYQNTAGGIGLSVMILYDLLQNPYSPYINPVFRVGGLLGF